MLQKISLLLFITTCIVLFSSYKHGAAHEGGLNRTGSDGGSASCAGGSCHSGNTPSTTVQLEIKNLSGNTIISYKPDSTYEIMIRGNNSSIVADEFGFQVSAVTPNRVQAGSFSVMAGSDVRVEHVNGLDIVEHKNPLNANGQNMEAHFYWKAPHTLAGNVDFYGILNVFEDDYGYGTFPNTAPILTITDGVHTGIGLLPIANMNVLPNPFCDYISINIHSENEELCKVQVYDINWKMIHYSECKSNNMIINSQSFQSGIYYIVTETKTFRKTFVVSKI